MENISIKSELAELERHLKSVAAKISNISKRWPELDKLDGLEKAQLDWILRKAERWHEDVQDIADDAKALRKDYSVGFIYKNRNNRFEISDLDYEFSCGSFMALYVSDPENYDHGWNFGRVEYRHGENEGYYFYNSSGENHHMLIDDMRVAIRKNE